MVEALRVHDSVWRLSLGGVNAYVVDSPDDGVTVVDAGWTWNAGDVRDGISDTGHSVEDVERVLVTHYDIDHVGGLSELGLRRSTTVHVGREDAGFLTGEEKPRVTNHKGALQRVVSLGIRRPDLNVEKVDDRDSVGGEFTAYHTPGHTPGHTVYVSESLGVAFLGDLVSEDGGEFKLLNRLMSYDIDEVKRSVERLVEQGPTFDLGLVGHGEPVESADEKLKRLSEKL